jgi:hypothetical protein
LASGDVNAGYGIDKGAALHFEGAKMVKVVASRPNARAYNVSLISGQVVETALRTEEME